MKKKMLVLRSLLIVFIISVSLLGCRKEETEVAEVEVETETESVKEDATSGEESTENVKIEQPIEIEKEETIETTESVDWETFAGQENNIETNIAILNENTGEQEIVIGNGIGVENTTTCKVKEGDRIAVPIRENYERVCYYSIKGEAMGELIDLYIKGETQLTQNFVEIPIEEGENYSVYIKTDIGERYFYIDNNSN